ncbi:MAG: hypothetical protein ACLQU2_07130 [Candidatus Binataceae bacterium]
MFGPLPLIQADSNVSTRAAQTRGKFYQNGPVENQNEEDNVEKYLSKAKALLRQVRLQAVGGDALGVEKVSAQVEETLEQLQRVIAEITSA